MVKTLLMIPPITNEEIYSKYSAAAPVLAPLGICYIAAVLEKRGHDVEVIDSLAENLTLDELKRRIERDSPDIIGISALTVVFNRAVETAKMIKSLDRDIITVIGGPHVSSIPKETMESHDCFDIGVVGEGEHTFLELVEKFNTNGIENLEAINGLVFKKEGEIVLTPEIEPIKNLDELPHPARHLLPNIQKYNINLTHEQRPNFAHIVPSRGCPFRCIYCDQNVFGHKWRAFSAEYMINEVEALIKKYKVRTLQIQDDLFTLKRERVIKFCELIKERGIDITWNLSSRVNLIDEELASLMKESGCEVVYFGIESGVDEVLKKIRKGITTKQVIKGVDITKKAGLRPHGSFILGLPFDTKDTIEETIKFALSLPLDVATFHLAVPYPNTEFEKIAPDYGEFTGQDWSKYRGHPSEVLFITNGLTSKYLINKQREAYLRFYLRPRTIMDTLRRIRSLKDLMSYLGALRTLV